MTVSDDLRDLFDRYPIAHIIMICCGFVSLVPSLLLLYAVLRSSIHANCRIMMCLWILAQLLVYATVAWLSISNMQLDEPHLKQCFDADGNDAFILRWYVLAWLLTTCFELGISLERGFSIHNPSRYHSSSASYLVILLYGIFAFAFGYQVSAWILSRAQKTEAVLGTIFSNLIDIGSCSTNVVVLRFAGRKMREDHKHLNERYQIIETYSIARAMMPIYFMSTIIKVVMIVINWVYFIHILPITINQLLYISLSEVCCGIMSAMFLIHHVRLRAKLDGILCSSNKVIPNADPYKNTSDNHFRMLSLAWNR